MKAQKTESDGVWTKAPVANLVRYEPSGIYFARAKVRGKLVRKSLDTNILSVAKLRLGDVLDAEHRAIAPSQTKIIGKMTFGDALGIFRERQKHATDIKEGTKAYNERAACDLLKTWPGLEQTDVKRITKFDCLEWRAKFGKMYSPTVINGTLSVLRRVFDIAMDSGARYDNPAKDKDVKRARVRRKELRLPEPDQFIALVAHVRGNGSGRGGHSADAIEFFSYAGPRLTEASRIYGRDCSFAKNEIIIRGDPITGTKNWEIRRVPMIPEMRQLLERLKTEREEQDFLNNPVLKVRKFKRSLQNACNKLGLHRLTHHDLRHLFATRCIESSVDVPTVAKWLGHKDGGVLAMQTYGHLRDKHSENMAQKVTFGTPQGTVTNQVDAEIKKPGENAQNEKPTEKASQAKSIPQVKAAYSYPWWASSEALEMFWGQANEPVQILPLAKYLQSAKTAMGREVFEQELAEPQTMLEELTARVGSETIEKLRAKISASLGMTLAA
jgi:integrase